MTENLTKTALPTLRFPEFEESEGWEEAKLEEVITTLTPPKKLQTTDYLKEGNFPIIDQSQSAICGWTNDREALISSDSPLLIFGDHTCALKIVNVPFAQGADGIKILKANGRTDPSFLYQYLLSNPVKQEQYKRHFSILKEKTVVFPSKDTGEQRKIAATLSSLDELIAAESEKLEALQTHKRGLMQGLFPAEGETVPRLRFGEFKGVWEERTLGSVCSNIASGKDKNDPAGIYNLYGSTGIIGKTNANSHNGDLILVARVGANAGFLHRAKGQFGVTDNTLIISLYISENIDFAYYILEQYSLNKLMFGSGQPLITGGQLKNLIINWPKPEEQQKIAATLSTLDALLTAQRDKIDALKLHKKGLMQGLFPS